MNAARNANPISNARRMSRISDDILQTEQPTILNSIIQLSSKQRNYGLLVNLLAHT